MTSLRTSSAAPTRCHLSSWDSSPTLSHTFRLLADIAFLSLEWRPTHMVIFLLTMSELSAGKLARRPSFLWSTIFLMSPLAASRRSLSLTKQQVKSKPLALWESSAVAIIDTETLLLCFLTSKPWRATSKTLKTGTTQIRSIEMYLITQRSKLLNELPLLILKVFTLTKT